MRTNRSTGMLAAAIVGAGMLVAAAPASAAVPAGLSPIVARTAQNVTSTPLPTTQIDGVAWSQALVGNTVFVGGSFANARPAGAAAGTNLIPRANLLAYNLTDGTLISSFAPNPNAQVRAVAATPDGSRVFVAGDFTSIGGKPHAYLAEFTAAGQLVDTWRPSVNSAIKAIAATNTSVYVTGFFTAANGNPASHLAAFDIATGNLLNWLPSADSFGTAITVTTDGSKVIAGGNFATVNGTKVSGLAALDATTGALVPWAATNKIYAYGANAAFTSLRASGNSVYGTTYTYNGTASLEGTFSANASNGAVNWVADCHGDTYDTYASGDTLYTVGHPHFCANLGGWEDSTPMQYQRTLALTTAATGTTKNNSQPGYASWPGAPSPSIVAWNPTLEAGLYTKQYQAAWSVTGNADYVVEAGEFPTVNGVGQQGLVRFAVPSISPDKTIPQYAYGSYTPTVTPLSTTSARVTIPANYDRDSLTLSYVFKRTANGGKPVYSTTVDSTWWNRPGISFVDTNLTPGQTYWYSVSATDPSGNVANGNTTQITMPTTNPAGTYAKAVQADAPTHYWRMDAPSGATTANWTGASLLTSGAGVTHGAAGAISGDTNTADTFNGASNGYAQTTSALPGPATFGIEAWVKTTSTKGGEIVDFGNTTRPLQSPYSDRAIYFDPAGKIHFYVKPSASSRAIASTASYNDGQWHQVVASLSSAGMALYVDGQQVANDSTWTTAAVRNGYWHIGGDNLAGLPGIPKTSPNSYLAGSIDEVSIYPTALSPAAVSAHYTASGR